MESQDQGYKKMKVGFVVSLVFAIVFLLGNCALGYLYWHKLDDRNKLANSKQEVEASLQKVQNDLDAANKQIADLTAASDSSGQSISSLQDQIASYKAGMTKISAYKEFLKYYNSVLEIHRGFIGWTDQEYAIGRQKAVATGDNDFVAIVDYAWNDTSVDPTTRVIDVHKAIVTGLERGIK